MTNRRLIMTTTSPSAPGLRHLVLAVAAFAFATPAMQAVAGPMSWISGDHVQGNGSIKKQSRDLQHYTGVALSLPGNVELHIGNSENITIETDDNLLPLIETVIEDGVLKIRPAKKHMNLDPHSLKIVLNAKAVDRIALGGSGSIDSDALKATRLQFDIGGSGNINVKGLEADSTSVALGGSGSFKAAGGNTGKLSLSIGGSGDVQAGQLKAGEVSVSIGGSGQSTVWATNALSVSIAGSGDVSYYGDPKTSKTVLGSGSLRRLGAAPH
jgi:hypothetical protein